MILLMTVVALPLVLLAFLAHRFNNNLEEIAWRMVAISMIVIPAASLLPKFDIGFHIPLFTTDEAVSFTEPPRLLYATTTPDFAIAIYGVVASALVLRLAIATLIAERVRVGRRSVRVPVTVGLFAPAIVLPLDSLNWSETKRATILAHESAHVRRRDPLWRFTGQLALAICWFHPFAWLAARSIERLAEHAADRDAVAVAGNRCEYAELLLQIVSESSRAGRMMIAPAINDSDIARRIHSILQARAAPRRVPAIVTLALSFLLATSVVASMTKQYVLTPPHRLTQMSDEEFFRKRDQYRTLFRERLQGFFRSFR